MSNDDEIEVTEETKEAREKRLALDRLIELEDIKKILDTKEGLRFFKRIMVEGKVFSTTFTGNSTGYFLEGQRNFALKIFHDVAECAPDKVVALMLNPTHRKPGEDVK